MKIDTSLSNVSGLQLFQLLRYSSLILTGILLAKSGIDQGQIGTYETFLMIAGVFSLFWVQGIIKGVLPMLASTGQEEKGNLIFNTFLSLTALSLLSALLVFLLNKPVSNGLLHGEALPYPYLLALYLILSSPSMLVEYIYLVNNQPKKILVYGIVIFTLQVLVVGVPPLMGYPIKISFLGLLLVSALRLIWFGVELLQYKNLRFNMKITSEVIRVSAPLILSTLLSSSAQYVDGFIITSKFTQADFAIFRYGARELPLALLLANSLSMAMVPRFAQSDLSSPLAELRSETYRLGFLLFPVSLVLLLVSHWAFPVVFSQGFAGSATIFNIYLMLVISRLLFPQSILMGKGLNGVIVRASFFEIIVNISLSLWFANLFGMYGVAYATFVAYLFEKGYLAIACFRKLNILPAQYLPLKLYLSSSVILVLVFIFVEFILY